MIVCKITWSMRLSTRRSDTVFPVPEGPIIAPLCIAGSIGVIHGLRAVFQQVSGGVLLTDLPSECYKRWENLAAYHASLSGTIPLFEIRESAWKIVESLVDEKRIKAEELRQKSPRQGVQSGSYNFSHDGVEMDFASARHLALCSYVSISWSIYDRLSNICGRLAAPDEISKNPKQNPKLVEQLLTKEYHLKMAYDWPTRVTYTIRNWLVHDGDTIGDVRLFHSNEIEDGLRMHNDAVIRIEELCKIERDSNRVPKRCCVSGSANPWKEGQDKNLMEVLRLYHHEVDTMLAGLVKWSVDSFVGQFTAFSERDKSVLTTTAIN